ncbi:stressosome-associated protein Prli42 [Staphylospora marina]|nr:stressosome-associated protein Prli42 [Staphylospora marina]
MKQPTWVKVVVYVVIFALVLTTLASGAVFFL